VSFKLNTQNYELVERAVRRARHDEPLPDWIPRGDLPVVNKADWHQYGGEPVGIYKALDPELSESEEPNELLEEGGEPTDE